MTLYEMRQAYDKYYAFQSYETVHNAKELEIIPKPYHEYFPDYCICGSENIINLKLTMMQCVDPRCPCKQALGLAEMFSRFGAVGLAEANCNYIYKLVSEVNSNHKKLGKSPLLHSNSYVELLNLDIDQMPAYFTSSALGETFISEVARIKSRTYTFPEMVSKLGLPELGNSAQKLFTGIDSFDALQQKINEAGGVGNFCETRGCYDPMKKYWLYVSLEDLYVASCILGRTLKQEGLQILPVCITGSCYPDGVRLTKTEFINMCNRRGTSKDISELVSAAINSDVYYESSKIEDLNNKLSLELDTKDLPERCSGQQLKEILSNHKIGGIPLYEIQISSAKMSVPYIIADQRSNSSKYLAGLSRGIEYNADGSERKVLITSRELLDIIDTRVEKWEKEMIEQCQQILKSESLDNLKQMNLMI